MPMPAVSSPPAGAGREDARILRPWGTIVFARDAGGKLAFAVIRVPCRRRRGSCGCFGVRKGGNVPGRRRSRRMHAAVRLNRDLVGLFQPSDAVYGTSLPVFDQNALTFV